MGVSRKPLSPLWRTAPPDFSNGTLLRNKAGNGASPKPTVQGSKQRQPDSGAYTLHHETRDRHKAKHVSRRMGTCYFHDLLGKQT